MTESEPVACTLGPEALGVRLVQIRAFTAANLLSHQLGAGVLRLRYRFEAAPQLRRIVELEQSCCAFLNFSITQTSEDVCLTITAPSHSGESAEWFFAQFLPETPGEPMAPRGCARACT